MVVVVVGVNFEDVFDFLCVDFVFDVEGYWVCGDDVK